MRLAISLALSLGLGLGSAGCGEGSSSPSKSPGGSGGGGASVGGSAGGGQLTASGSESGGAAGIAPNGGTPANGGESQGGASAGSAGSGGGTMDVPDDATVVLFLIDGLQTATLQTGIASGATNIKAIVDGGVTATTSYSTSPAARLQLPDLSLPWGNATSGNVAVHTGCHLFESSQMDDIFLAAKKAGIKSVFAGGDANYAVFTNADFHYSGMLSDAEVVQHAIDHLKADHVRLIRLHLQRIRDFWSGPASEMTAASPYIQHLLEIDGLIGDLRQALEQQGAWPHTYFILSSDHGMGQASTSEHPQSTLSSWKNVAVFYGPNVKQGSTIPYAELPDLAVLTNHLLKLPALQGHTDPAVTLTHQGPTGTLLTNIFVGNPDDLEHPRYIEKYLSTGTYAGSGDNYADYREGMLKILQ